MLTFNRVHKNGWVSFKLAGVPGAVYIDKRMFVDGQIPAAGSTIELTVAGLKEPGADATEVDAAKAKARLEKEAAKATKAAAAAEKAQARLVKLQEQAAKASAAVEKAKAVSGSNAESTGDAANL
jgi:hypothetical protein